MKAFSGVEPTLEAQTPLLELLSPAVTGVDFKNQIVETETHNVVQYINQYNGGGVAVADFNNDQLPDLYFVCTNGKNRLYKNLGNLTFSDITDQAGVGSEDGFETAVTVVDINSDGRSDLFVCRAGLDKDGSRSAKLFINNGPSSANGEITFTEKAAEYGLADKSPATGANFFDFDGDGDLDCYLLNHPTDNNAAHELRLKYGPDGKTPVPDLTPKAPYDSDHFYRNDNGRFVDISKEAGIQNFGFGMSATITDFNTDGWPDVYVANDFLQPDNLFINNKKGGFTEEIARYFRHSSMTTMGADLSDFDNDGRVDLVALDMLPAKNFRQKSLVTTNTLSRYINLIQYGYFPPVARNVLQRNNGNGTFSDIACLAGVYKNDWAWSCLFADLDNDGIKDLHITNGYRREVTNRDYIDFIEPSFRKKIKEKPTEVLPHLNEMPVYKPRNFVYRNAGNWQFEDQSGNWMTMPASWSSGCVWADLDLDGDLELVTNNLEDPAFIYKNLSREKGLGNYLQAKLQGSPANPLAVGAAVLIEYQGVKQYQELTPTRGLYSSVEHLIHFGLGQTTQIDRLTVRWPDGKFQVLNQVPANQRLQLKWTDASGYVAHLAPASQQATLLTETKNALDFRHAENPYNDFENWLLNPWYLTDLGPCITQGDVNGDGLDDFFIGNAFDAAGAVFLQNSNGSFRSVSTQTFENDKPYEDHGGIFFDADGDKDLDLFVMSGGMDANTEAAWQCRLYLNDGKGNFSKADGAIPAHNEIGMRATVKDYDQDGDPDLFIGNRLAGKKWPLSPRSLVLQNDGNGKFSDVTSQVAGDFERCGMVTDLAWADLNGDGQQELIVVGEWMPVAVFQLINNKLKNVTEQFGLAKSNGLWYRLAIADLDKDGDLDLVTGNLGLNTRFTATPDAPFFCFAKDFDNNNTIDPIVAYTEEGKIYPIVQKDVLVKQMPVLKKRFLYAKDYANAVISDIWPQKELDAGLTLTAYTLETCWWENQNGKLQQRRLPAPAQVSPVQGILCADFNADGHTDLLLAGNKYGLEVETNACDASNGALLLGDGKGNFTWLDNTLSGFWAMGEARDLALLRSNAKPLILVANNSGMPQIFR
ncbi:MAG: VCBS repeat-containing protein [Saprospiraceae bacterium]|nr:VCBS repeat-containing protein [Saprospiraceae bacterium]